jgi:hypothetical protein
MTHSGIHSDSSALFFWFLMCGLAVLTIAAWRTFLGADRSRKAARKKGAVIFLFGSAAMCGLLWLGDSLGTSRFANTPEDDLLLLVLTVVFTFLGVAALNRKDRPLRSRRR